MSNYFNGTGTIGFTCDNCGRELLGCTWVNGMKFCAKCYQETFVNNTSQFVDLLHKEMYELKIADLEAKLAEHNEYFRSFSCENFNEFQDFISTFMLTPHEEQTLIRELKQQIAEKDKEIDERMMAFEKRCQEYYKSKEFTIEQLEKVKEWINNNLEENYGLNGSLFYVVNSSKMSEEIDNQIKQLKEGK